MVLISITFCINFHKQYHVSHVHIIPPSVVIANKYYNNTSILLQSTFMDIMSNSLKCALPSYWNRKRGKYIYYVPEVL